MSEVDEEVYTTIFNALRHGVRRRILLMLSETQMNFTTINENLNISSSHLTYHLDSLRELVSKNEFGYRLSVFGWAAVDIMNGIENPPRVRERTLPILSLEWFGVGITALTQEFVMYVNGFDRTGVRNTNANRIFSWFVVLIYGIMIIGGFFFTDALPGLVSRLALPLFVMAVIHSTFIQWRLNNRLSSPS